MLKKNKRSTKNSKGSMFFYWTSLTKCSNPFECHEKWLKIHIQNVWHMHHLKLLIGILMSSLID